MRSRMKKAVLLIVLLTAALLLCACRSAPPLPAPAEPETVSAPAEKPPRTETPAPETQTDAETETETQTDAKSAPPAPQAEALPVCTLSIRCDTLLARAEELDEGKRGLLPPDGCLLYAEAVFSEGESVFDVLLRETRSAGLHMEFNGAALYGSAYVEGIGNLYEFDGGALSGWMYRVNGVFPNYGCAQYTVHDGDVIEWVYTCDLGADVGGAGAAEGQR